MYIFPVEVESGTFLKTKKYIMHQLLHINNRVNLVYLPFWFLFAILSWHYYENIGGILSKIW